MDQLFDLLAVSLTVACRELLVRTDILGQHGDRLHQNQGGLR